MYGNESNDSFYEADKCELGELNCHSEIYLVCNIRIHQEEYVNLIQTLAFLI
jgi:hypothetical protein